MSKNINPDTAHKRLHTNQNQNDSVSKKLKTDDHENDDDEYYDDEDNGTIVTQTIQGAATVAPPPTSKADANIIPIPGLPEGFFDDPVKDAKARNIVLSDVLDVEFEKFKREMQVEELKQDAVNEYDDDVRDIDRELEEVDDLIHKWSKIENLHERKAQLLKAKMNEKKIVVNKTTGKNDDNDDDDDDDEIGLDDVINLKLRSKIRC